MTAYPLSLTIVLMLIAFQQLAKADAPAPRFDDAKLKLVPAALSPFIGKEIAGAVTVVVTRDGVAAIDTIGEADLAEHTPMKADDLFWIASMTKPVTATAVMMLQEEGKLSIDDPVGKYLPELAHLKTADGKEAVVTIKHLMTHSSGLPEATHDQSVQAHTLADLIPHYAERPLQFEPGSKWQYCQSGINSLGRIVEVVSGEPFATFLQKRLFDPLGMKDTTFYPTREQLVRLARSYKLEAGKLQPARPFLPETAELDSTSHYPAANGGLYSTAPDYARFFRMILSDGRADGHHYLKPETITLMTSVQSGDLKTGFTPGSAWGLGWSIVREPQGVSAALSPGSCGHGGAYGTQAWIDPVKGVGYLLMVQRSNFPNSDGSEVRKAFQDAAAAAIVHP